MRILLAEDDLTSRTILAALLQKWGHDPVVTCDGDEAWEALQNPDAPKLVLLDWNMPGLDGLEVCRRVREIETSNPPYVIILTARTDMADIVTGLDAGANDYVSKPFNNDELQARIRVGQRMLELQAELLEAKNALAHQATHDPLTGAPNRRAILDRLDSELARAERTDTSLSIGLCDIDHFKKVNDKYGHPVGDKVLCSFVDAIQSGLRSYDLVGRIGGEEFLVISPDTKGSAEEALYQRLRSKIAGLWIDTKQGEVSITVSIGVANVRNFRSAGAILEAADAALYEAKNNGRNRVAYADRRVGEENPR